MRNLLLVVIALTGLLFVATTFGAEEGGSIFSSHRCGSCHKLDTGKANPSLREIAQVYQGKEDQLLSYLKGESASIMKPEKGDIMKKYIEKTKALSDSERKALADYMLSQKE